MSQPTNTIHFFNPEPQNIAEARFVTCMQNGQPCELGRIAPSEGDDTNTIRANLIRFFALGGSEKMPMQGSVIRLQGAWIPEELDLSRENIQYTMEFSLCHFDQNVKMEQVQCPALYFDGAHLEKGFEGEEIRIRGDLCFRQKATDDMMILPFTTHGEIQLADAKIGGNLDCHLGIFFPKQSKMILKTALFANGIKVGGHINLTESSISGAVRLNGATIGSLECRRTVFDNSEINVVRAHIKDSIVLLELSGGGMFHFDFSKAERVARDDSSYGKFKFSLRSFVYRDFPTYSGNIQFFIADWLSNHSAGGNFMPQPFEQAAKVLSAMGYRGDAREVLFAMEKHRTEYEYTKLSGWRKHWRKFWRRGWEKATGYNHLVWQMLKTSIGIIVTSASLFGLADYGGYVVPHQPVVLANQQYKNVIAKMPRTEAERKCSESLRPTEAVECLFPNYPRFNPFSFSVDIFIPLFSLRQEGYWYPQADTSVNFVIRWFLLGAYWIVVMAGWILTSIFVLTITGIWQRQQAGG